MLEDKRIGILDSFRFIAVLFVMIYHYYSRWDITLGGDITDSIRATKNEYLKLGSLGVQFFFIISGFIIMYTIRKADSYKNFLIKRFIRLFPPILLCSVITYLVIQLFDKDISFPEAHITINSFIPSLTFSNVCFWQFLFRHTKWAYIDGAYWSLHIEVTFYILVGFLYFKNKEKFIRNWLIIAYILTFTSFLYEFMYPNQKLVSTFSNMFLISLCIVYFTIGILGSAIFLKEKLSTKTIIMGGILVFYQVVAYYLQSGKFQFFIFCLLMLLFTCFIVAPNWLKFLDVKILQRIGVISYTVYLIHQFVGVLLISKLMQWINIPALNLYIPLVVMLLVILFAELSYRVYERPVNAYLKKAFSKKLI